MTYNLRGGVLIIGSLFWQDWLVKPGDDIRKNWRDNHLTMSSVIDVSVPIRYGRFSGQPNKGNQTYTMVFDYKLHPENYGIAKAIPFQHRKFNQFSEINKEVITLSEVEGKNDQSYIKGSRNRTVAWCVCGIIFNPKVDNLVKTNILENWSSLLKKNEIGYNYFKKNSRDYSMTKNGEFLFPWPKELNTLDFLVATATKPELRQNINELTIEEISNHVKNRKYFKPNMKNGISTYQDLKIKENLD